MKRFVEFLGVVLWAISVWERDYASAAAFMSVAVYAVVCEQRDKSK